MRKELKEPGYDDTERKHAGHSRSSEILAADEVQEAFREADLPQEIRQTKGLLKLTFVEVV